MSETLTGKVAIVTGAGGGIGSAYGERLAERGATVVVADLNLGAAGGVAKALSARGLDAWAAEVDISVPESAEGLVGAVLERNGRLDILVNNAAIYPGDSDVPG